MKRILRRLVSGVSAGGLLYVAGSWAASRVLAERLLSSRGLGPTPDRYDELLAALEANAPLVGSLRHNGSPLLPVELSSTFASPGEPERRSTILFLHGKGGNASEWREEAVRALSLGYNVLLPDLRGHGRSGGAFFTLGFLEKDDLALTVAAANAGFGLDPDRIGIHSCSAGSSVALEFAADRAGIRAIWLESPFAEAFVMARHYLSQATRVPAPLLDLTTRWAVRRAVAHVRRELGLPPGSEGLDRVDPLAAVARVHAPILLVHGADDRLVPARFTERLASALPPHSGVWNVPGAGHCHHGNEPQAVARKAYARRWEEFFTAYLPA